LAVTASPVDATDIATSGTNQARVLFGATGDREPGRVLNLPIFPAV
jgi:hypothetical protein